MRKYFTENIGVGRGWFWMPAMKKGSERWTCPVTHDACWTREVDLQLHEMRLRVCSAFLFLSPRPLEQTQVKTSISRIQFTSQVSENWPRTFGCGLDFVWLISGLVSMLKQLSIVSIPLFILPMRTSLHSVIILQTMGNKIHSLLRVAWCFALFFFFFFYMDENKSFSIPTWDLGLVNIIKCRVPKDPLKVLKCIEFSHLKTRPYLALKCLQFIF